MDDKPRRRRLWFVLQTLLLVVPAVAILAAQGAPFHQEIVAYSDEHLHASESVKIIWNGRFLIVAGIEGLALTAWIIWRWSIRLRLRTLLIAMARFAGAGALTRILLLPWGQPNPWLWFSLVGVLGATISGGAGVLLGCQWRGAIIGAVSSILGAWVVLSAIFD